MASEQRAAALEEAQRVRSGQASIKAQLRDLAPGTARVLVADLLEEPDPIAGSFRTTRLLGAIPRLGELGVTRALAASGIAVDCQVRDLSPRRRRMLASYLRGEHKPPPRPLPGQMQLVAGVVAITEAMVSEVAEVLRFHVGGSEERLRTIARCCLERGLRAQPSTEL